MQFRTGDDAVGVAIGPAVARAPQKAPREDTAGFTRHLLIDKRFLVGSDGRPDGDVETVHTDILGRDEGFRRTSPLRHLDGACSGDADTQRGAIRATWRLHVAPGLRTGAPDREPVAGAGVTGIDHHMNPTPRELCQQSRHLVIGDHSPRHAVLVHDDIDRNQCFVELVGLVGVLVALLKPVAAVIQKYVFAGPGSIDQPFSDGTENVVAGGLPV